MSQMTVQQAFELALQHHKAGRLREAERIYRQILAVHPKHGDCLHLLGVIAAQACRPDVAVDFIRQALALKPDWPEALSNLGAALRDSGRPEEAIDAQRRAIALKPDYAQAHYNLGVALKDAGRAQEAVVELGRAIALEPGYADAHNSLGVALHELGRFDEAIAACRQALALKPDYAEALNNLGVALCDSGQLAAAVDACRKALALKPDYPEAHNNLGIALSRSGRRDEAVAAYRQAIALKPDYAEALSNLGIALQDAGLLEEALATLGRAVALKPAYPQAHNNLGNALKDNGQLDEALAAYRRAMALKPGYSDAHGNLILALHYHPDQDAQSIAEELRRWSQQHAQPLRNLIRPHSNGRSPDRRLRIGYLSHDLRMHSVAFFLLPLLEAHDKHQFHITCYSTSSATDTITDRCRTAADAWCSLVGLSDDQAAQRIGDDRIDILIDLSGHTFGNRLLLLARKPAPVQVTYLGFPGSTGLSTIDYRLTDAYADPSEAEAHHVETLIRLPETAWCFAPLSGTPPITDPPAFASGQVTFGSFNNLAKITPPTLEMWSRLLRRLPAARLVLKSTAFRQHDTPARLRQQFSGLAVDPARIDLLPDEPTQLGHLQTYNRIDIALDTFPYHGTTTTCEALWMGVPVITLAGNRHASRVGVSLLSNVGLRELVAATPEHYVDIAAVLAGDPPRLTTLRSTLRQRMQASPLMDAPRLARNVEAAYRQMWQKWCAGQAASR